MEIESIIRAVLSLVFVAGLIFGCAAIYKRFFMGKSSVVKKDRRMEVVEYLYLDRTRRIVIVKKDGEELTILLGQNGETVLK